MQSTGQLPACLPRGRLDRPYNDFSPPALPSSATLVLCRTEGEVAHAVERTELGVDRIVALSPQAACECHMRRLEYLKLEDFYDVTAFVDADEPMLAFQSGWADAVDSFTWEAMPELRGAGLGPAGNYVFFLKVLIDTLYRTAFELAHLLRAVPAARIAYFDAPPDRPVADTLFFEVAPHATALPHVAAVYGARIERLSLPPSEPPPGKRIPALRPAVASLLPERALWQMRTGGRRALPKLLESALPFRRRPELVGQWLYDLGYAGDALERAGYRMRSLRQWPSRRLRPSGRLQAALRDLWPRLQQQDFFGDPFTWAGVDLRSLAQTRLEHWWFGIVPVMWAALGDSRRRFERRRPKAVAVYSPFTPEDHGRLQAARSLRIPTSTFQHGGFEGYCEYITYDLTDVRLADFRLVYGNGVVEYLQERARTTDDHRPHAEPIATGSPRLDALRSTGPGREEMRARLGIQPHESALGYVATSYMYRWYMCRCGYLGTSYFELLTRVAATLGRLRHRVIYKPFPEQPPDPMARLLADSPNVVVLPEVPFTELLPALDACVIDFPSTPLLEALLTPKPLLAYADARYVTLRPEGKDLLRRRAAVCEDPEEFLSTLEAFGSTSTFEDLAEPDDAFLRAYGTHLGDGRSAEHAAQALEEIIARSRG